MATKKTATKMPKPMMSKTMMPKTMKTIKAPVKGAKVSKVIGGKSTNC